MDDADGVTAALLHSVGRGGGAVAADRDEPRDAELPQRADGRIEQRRIVAGIGARDADPGTAAEVDPADGLDGQRGDTADVALHDPLEAVADAEHLGACQAGANGGGTNDGVDAGRGTATNEDGDDGRRYVSSSDLT